VASKNIVTRFSSTSIEIVQDATRGGLQNTSLQPALFGAAVAEHNPPSYNIHERQKQNRACLWHEQCLEV
jgi:hypothetical protein